MDLAELRVFLTVASERSFSGAARKLHRTQPAISQAIRRLEDALGERLFDRSSKEGRLTEAGRVLRDYAERLLRLAEETEGALHELQDLRRGRVMIGANEAGTHALLPIVETFRAAHPQVLVDVRRVAARQIGSAVLEGSLDFGILTFAPAERGLATVPLGQDELVLLTHPAHPLARRRLVDLEDVSRQPIIAHNDPSPARDRVLRLFEQRHAHLDIRMALPSLDSIKRAVEMKLGVALLPRRCALTEIARGQLAAVRVPDRLRRPRVIRFVYRRSGDLTHTAAAFLDTVRGWKG
jgi:DNA-binding transcriptional LysR family regulator